MRLMLIEVDDEHPAPDGSLKVVREADDVVACGCCEFFDRGEPFSLCTRLQIAVPGHDGGFCAWGERPVN